MSPRGSPRKIVCCSKTMKGDYNLDMTTKSNKIGDWSIGAAMPGKRSNPVE